MSTISTLSFSSDSEPEPIEVKRPFKQRLGDQGKEIKALKALMVSFNNASTHPPPSQNGQSQHYG